MLSFDLSFIDVALVLAVIVLFILHLKRPGAEASTPTELSTKGQDIRKSRRQPVMTPQTLGEGEPTAFAHKCPHQFGYLKKLPRGALVPDECLGCRRVLECFSR